MTDRTKRKSERGHQREDWVQFHQRIVQLPDPRGGKKRHEKVIKLTELLRERENKTDQSKFLHSAAGGTKSIQQDGKQERMDIETEKPFGKICNDKTEKSAPIDEGYENKLNEDSSDVTVPSTATRTEISQTGAKGNFATERNHITAKTNEKQFGPSKDNANDKGRQQNSKAEGPTANEVLTAWDYDEQPNEYNNSRVEDDDRQETQFQQVPSVAEMAVSTVKIKKEVVDKAAATWMMDTELSDDSSESEDDSEMLDQDNTSIYFKEDMEEESEDTSHPFTQRHQSVEAATAVSKRKSVNEGHSSGKQKRLHMTNVSRTEAMRKSGTDTARLTYDVSESATVVDQRKDLQEESGISQYAQTVSRVNDQGSSTTSQPPYQTDSDREWEQISRKIRHTDR